MVMHFARIPFFKYVQPQRGRGRTDFDAGIADEASGQLAKPAFFSKFSRFPAVSGGQLNYFLMLALP